MPKSRSRQLVVQPLSQQLLVRVVIYGAIIIGIATVSSYYITFNQNKKDTLNYLHQYMQERKNLENEVFIKTEEHLKMFEDEFMKFYLSDVKYTEEDFWKIYFVDKDGATRMKEEYFNESFQPQIGRRQGVSSFIGNNHREISSDLQRRLMIANILVSRYGPAWTSIGSLHVTYPENAITIYYPLSPWGLKAKADLRMNELGVIAATLQKNNFDRKPVWTGLYYDETAGNWTITYEVPVDYKGRHLFNPSMDVKLEALMNRLISEHPEGAYNFLIRNDGYLVASPGELKEEQKWKGMLSLDEIDNPSIVHMYHLLKASNHSPGQEISFIDDKEKDNYLISAFLGEPGWWFVMVYPKSLISQKAHEASRVVLIMGLLIFTLYYLVIYFIINKKVRVPLGKLLEAVTLISKGNYNRVADNPDLLPTSQKNEIGQFARSFVEMSSQIKDSNLKLEEQVAERTNELALANQTKDKFFSLMAHDLKGPIGSLSMLFNDIFQCGTDIDDNLFAQLGRMTKQTYQLLEDLLIWAQSQKGELDFCPTNFPISAPLQNNIDLFHATTRQKNIEFVSEFDPSIYVYADLDMITTIVRNLINNATKFTSSGGKITVSAFVENDQVRISVSDTGVGMTREVRESLFQIDKKINSTKGTNSEAGTGLGLILTNEFVKMHGNELGCDSELNKGSTFWFTLPIGDANKETSQQIEKENMEKLARMQILVVDDNQLHLETSSAVLKEMNLNFETVSTGEGAVERFQSNKFDLILMDIEMPGMNGIEASQLIRRETDKPPKIIALSSYSKNELKKLASGVNFDGYLNKPLVKARLLNLFSN